MRRRERYHGPFTLSGTESGRSGTDSGVRVEQFTCPLPHHADLIASFLIGNPRTGEEFLRARQSGIGQADITLCKVSHHLINLGRVAVVEIEQQTLKVG